VAQSAPASTPEAEPQVSEVPAEPVRTPVRTREEVPAGVAKPDAPKGPPAAAAASSPTTAAAPSDDDFGEDEFGEDDFGDAAASPPSADASSSAAETPAVADAVPAADAAGDGGAPEVDPSEWDCFGSIEPDHKECKACVARKKCAAKAGIELDD